MHIPHLSYDVLWVSFQGLSYLLVYANRIQVWSRQVPHIHFPMPGISEPGCPVVPERLLALNSGDKDATEEKWTVLPQPMCITVYLVGTAHTSTWWAMISVPVFFYRFLDVIFWVPLDPVASLLLAGPRNPWTSGSRCADQQHRLQALGAAELWWGMMSYCFLGYKT